MTKLPARALLAASVLLCAAPVAAQPAEEFYKGKTMRMLIGYGPRHRQRSLWPRAGDAYGAAHSRPPHHGAAEHAGCCGLTMTNALYNTMPHDGTVIGMPSRQHITEPLFGNEQARYDVLKFTWIGNMSRDTALCFTWHTSGIARMADAKAREVMVGSTGQASPSYMFPRLLDSFLGTRFKPLLGYPDSGAIGIAMEQGELRRLLQLHARGDPLGAAAMAARQADQRAGADDLAQAPRPARRAADHGHGARRDGAPGFYAGFCRPGGPAGPWRRRPTSRPIVRRPCAPRSTRRCAIPSFSPRRSASGVEVDGPDRRRGAAGDHPRHLCDDRSRWSIASPRSATANRRRSERAYRRTPPCA